MINVIALISCSQNQEHTAAQIDDIKILSEGVNPSIEDISQVPNTEDVYDSNPSTTLEETEEETEGETEDTLLPKGSCGFDYTISSESSIVGVQYPTDFTFPEHDDEVDSIAYMEPEPEFTWKKIQNSENLTMPSHTDTMPLFDRSLEWTSTRCYELPQGAIYLTEEEAFDMYRDIIEKTTGVPIEQGDGARSVLGLRGSWPGTFDWNGNTPNFFNDSIVVIWVENNDKYVREFHAHTDTGAYNFGYHNSSSLRPNRRYRYTNGWHRGYNALQINEWGYKVRDDSNKNGYWDSDRNGWLNGGSADHERAGSGHNIHLASVDAPLSTAQVDNWSAGCQTIPGYRNWTQFIDVVWEELETEVDYYLVDARDISPKVWNDCTPDGSHSCPWEINSHSFVSQGTTEGVQTSEFDVYNCSTADESGPEVVYLFTTDSEGIIDIEVDCDEPIDVDVHLLDANDANSCINRAHHSFTQEIEPGRYFIVVDTWVDNSGDVKSGDFTLRVDFQD